MRKNYQVVRREAWRAQMVGHDSTKNTTIEKIITNMMNNEMQNAFGVV